MYKTSIENIKEGKNVREHLLAVKNLIKDEKIKRGLAYYLGGDYQVFIQLIKDKDPKIRKNSALIMGELEDEDLLSVIYEAYETEETLYIRADLLRSMSKYDYGAYIDKFQNRLKLLKNLSLNDKENAKHYTEELKLLRLLLYKSENCKHELIASNKKTQLYLTAYPGCIDILVKYLKGKGKRIAVAGLGVMVYDTCIDELKDIRLYKEMLIPVIEDASYERMRDVADSIIQSDLTGILRSFFDGELPFTYRLQLKGLKKESLTGRTVKEISSVIDEKLAYDLVNVVSDYQIELRIIFKSSNRFALYLKPSLVKDLRFEYRKSSTSEAMKPVLAANLCEYCSEYFSDNARVMDPFCGSGILLIERNKRKQAARSMGVDLLDLAIEAAKNNVSHTEYNINTVCKNFFEFENKPEYMVDELITDLPRVSSKRNEAYIFKLYKKFLERAVSFVKKGGYLFLYTNLPSAIRENLNRQQYELIEERMMKDKGGASLFIVRVL